MLDVREWKKGWIRMTSVISYHVVILLFLVSDTINDKLMVTNRTLMNQTDKYSKRLRDIPRLELNIQSWYILLIRGFKTGTETGFKISHLSCHVSWWILEENLN